MPGYCQHDQCWENQWQQGVAGIEPFDPSSLLRCMLQSFQLQMVRFHTAWIGQEGRHVLALQDHHISRQKGQGQLHSGAARIGRPDPTASAHASARPDTGWALPFVARGALRYGEWSSTR